LNEKPLLLLLLKILQVITPQEWNKPLNGKR